MSNSTQNDEIKQMEKAMDEGFAESEKFLKGMKTPFDKPTQNDPIINGEWGSPAPYKVNRWVKKDSTQNDHETHTACIGRIKKEGASSTCCYCDPHEGCTLGMKPTQNECPAYVPDLIGRCMNCHHYHAYPENTQNDMVYKSEVEMSRLLQQLEGMELISPKLRQDIEKACIETNRATRADARKEVIKRIEAMPDKDVRPQITVWLESKEYCLGYNKALSNVLATLREEEKHG